MKKLLAMSAMALILSGAAAHAEDAAKTTATTTTTTTEAPAADAPAAPAADAKGPEHHGPGGMFERADANKDGVVSKDEFMAQQEDFFKTIDTNGDGNLSQDEVKAGRDKWHAMKKHKEDAPADAPK